MLKSLITKMLELFARYNVLRITSTQFHSKD